MTDLRNLPDVEIQLLTVLNDCPASATVPADLAAKVPYRAIYSLGGKALHPQFLDRPQVQVDSYGATRELAKALAETARVRLFNAWRAQTRVSGHGGVHRVTEVVSPHEIRTGTEPDGVFRFTATYQVFTRP